MPTEFPYKKHTKIICDLEIGDKVMTLGWGPQLDDKVHIIKNLKLSLTSQSGVAVLIDGYKHGWIDSDWFEKVIQ